MKKQRMQLIILLAALVLLVVGLFGLKKYNQSQEETPAEENKEVVVDITTEDVTDFSYEYAGETYSFEKVDETWYAANDHSLNIDQDTIAFILRNIAPLEATEIIENVTDMEQYGLATDMRMFSFSTTSETYTFYIGDLNSMASAYYICKPSDNKIYMVDSLIVNSFNYTWEDLIVVEEVEETTSTEETTEEAVVAETVEETAAN